MIRMGWILPLVAMAGGSVRAEGLVHFPQEVSAECRGGRAIIYDECGSQFDVLEAAVVAAEASGKTVLVVYGAEWCIWCHVLAAHLAGQAGVFRYDLEGEVAIQMEPGVPDVEGARVLRDFARARFVVAHIEAEYSDDGWDVVEALGGADRTDGGLPFVFTIRDGVFADGLDDGSEADAMTNRVDEEAVWYRGFHRAPLLEALRRMDAAARDGTHDGQ